MIRIYNIFSGKICNVISASSSNDVNAFNSMKFRPTVWSKPGTILSAVSIDGSIYQWQIPSGKLVFQLKS